MKATPRSLHVYAWFLGTKNEKISLIFFALSWVVAGSGYFHYAETCSFSRGSLLFVICVNSGVAELVFLKF